MLVLRLRRGKLDGQPSVSTIEWQPAKLRIYFNSTRTRKRGREDLSTRQCSKIVHSSVRELGADPSAYSIHSMRLTKASLIVCRTKKSSSRPRYLGIEVDDALEMAEQTECDFIRDRRPPV